MKKKRLLTKKCQAMALAGLIGAGTFLTPMTAWAIGPGETSSPGNTTTIISGGPGVTGPSAGNSGTSAQNTSDAWKKKNGAYRMPDGSAIENVLARGIDVSRWQGEINWSQVAADDVSFVMLGTRSKGAVDPYFHKNIQNASAAGVKVGVYIYSLATTTDMAKEEANFVLNLIHDYPISYPVAFDMEDSTQGNLSKQELADIANTFCKIISDAGYYPIIYANENWLKNKLDMSLMNYPVWVARYSAKPSWQNPVMWQATSSGSVQGISGNVDIDFQFKDFTQVIPVNTWRTINGNRYYYQNYSKQKNTWAPDGNDWYYMNKDGLASKGWVQVSGKYYYLNTDNGKMATGWVKDGGNWYYLGSSGAMATGWINDNGSWYYTNTNGVMQTGWLTDGGNRYYLKGSGVMATGWREMENAWYYFDNSGKMATDWADVNGSRYHFDGTGKMETGWKQIGGNWYYLKDSGEMATGWRQIGGSWYYLENSGVMATGWKQLDGSWYYLDGSGKMLTGVTEVGGKSYYLDPTSGKMAAGTTVDINGTIWQAGTDGVLSQLQQDNGSAEGNVQTGTAPAGENTQNGNVQITAPGTGAPSGSGQTGNVSSESPQPAGPGSPSGNNQTGSSIGHGVTGVNGGPGVGNQVTTGSAPGSGS